MSRMINLIKIIHFIWWVIEIFIIDEKLIFWNDQPLSHYLQFMIDTVFHCFVFTPKRSWTRYPSVVSDIFILRSLIIFSMWFIFFIHHILSLEYLNVFCSLLLVFLLVVGYFCITLHANLQYIDASSSFMLCTGFQNIKLFKIWSIFFIVWAESWSESERKTFDLKQSI